MQPGVQSSLIDDLTAFTASLDGLSPDQSPDDLCNARRAAFKQRDLYNMYVFSTIGDTERSKALLEVFDKALQATTYNVAVFKRFRQLCGRMGLLPTSHIIPEKFIQTTDEPVATGGFGDVWEGKYNDERVAIKALRIYGEEDVRKVQKIFCKEVAMWKRISHPNIVPFLGVSEAPAPLSMVSEWMPNGNVRDYVRMKPETSRLQLLLDITRGLSFLHSLEIVHGDLKGDNILIDKSGCARLNDFGFTSISSLNCTETSAPGFKGSFRWMAPELFSVEQNAGKSGLPTRQSDIFALGMVTFEVFTGQVPFPENKQLMVLKKITEGARPSRPLKTTRLGLSDDLWAVIQSSLAPEVEGRPSVSVFIDILERANPDIAVLEELTEFDASSEMHIRNLRRLFEYGDNTLLGMREEETLVLIEVFDRVLNSSLNDSTLRSRCLHGLQKVSARCGLLPKSYLISHDNLTEPVGASFTAGRVSSTCQRLMDGKLVAIKAISPDCIENFDAFKHKLCTNGVMWKRLRHPNVATFLGFASGSPLPSPVYPWMPKGALSEYVCEHPGVDKLSLLLDVARGLTYLHQYNLIHGNLTGHNILVDSNGVACISEYGLEIVLRDEASSESIPTNVRWTAPEVLSTNSRRIPAGDGGKAADVYSFAMVMFEILTGTAPFQNESDEKIMDRVATGLRPECPPDNPSQGLVDKLWGQMKACWNQEPKERPTASEVLQALSALGEAQHHEPAVPVEESDDEAIVGEWERVDDEPEETPPTHNERGEHQNANNQPGNSLVSLFSGLKSPYHIGSGTHRHRFGTKVEKHVRNFLHLPRHASAATTMETHGRLEVVAEKPTPGVEIVDEREEEVNVRDGCVPYVVSQPIPEGKTLKKVVITVLSKDQGWSSYPEDHGTYRGSWTWFELSVGSPKDSEGRWRGEVVRNLHAHTDLKEHTIEISDGELYEKAKSGDVLTVWALARYPGWRNTVKKVTIRYVVD